MHSCRRIVDGSRRGNKGSSARGKVWDERVSKLEAYETGLQMFYCVYTETAQAKNMENWGGNTERFFTN